jgi:hypothetical protein
MLEQTGITKRLGTFGLIDLNEHQEKSSKKVMD